MGQGVVGVFVVGIAEVGVTVAMGGGNLFFFIY